MDTMKDTKMQPATDAVIDTLRKMQPTAWVYEDTLGRKCVGFERPLPRSNTHEPLFSAATHAVVMGLVTRLEAAERERNVLKAKVEQMDAAFESLLIRCDDSDSEMYGTLSTSFVRDTVRIARAALEESK